MSRLRRNLPADGSPVPRRAAPRICAVVALQRDGPRRSIACVQRFVVLNDRHRVIAAHRLRVICAIHDVAIANPDVGLTTSRAGSGARRQARLSDPGWRAFLHPGRSARGRARRDKNTANCRSAPRAFGRAPVLKVGPPRPEGALTQRRNWHHAVRAGAKRCLAVLQSMQSRNICASDQVDQCASGFGC